MPVFIEDERTIDIARKVLDDIGELPHCTTYRVGYLQAPPPEGLPSLILMFDYPQCDAVPALAIGLTALSTGRRFKDDSLRRVIRNGVEQYLRKHGVPLPVPQP